MSIIEQLRAEIAKEVLDVLQESNAKWTNPPYETDPINARMKSYHMENLMDEVANQFGVER